MKAPLYRILALSLFLALCITQNSQGYWEFELQFLPGITLVDIEAASGRDEDQLEDWNQFQMQINLQSYFYKLGPLKLGAELGYNRLYWYSYFAYFGGTPLYGENEVTTINIYGLAGISGGIFFGNAGLGPHFFEDGTTPGLSASGGIRIPIGPGFKIPIFIRSDVIFGDGIPTPLSGGIGFEISK